ncbi:hypothetical protein EMPG_14676, partial [Blastomyces silverae]
LKNEQSKVVGEGGNGNTTSQGIQWEILAGPMPEMLNGLADEERLVLSNFGGTKGSDNTAGSDTGLPAERQMTNPKSRAPSHRPIIALKAQFFLEL